MNDVSLTGPLSGKVAVITGAGRGIGRAVACAYAQAGAAVVCSARNEQELRETLVLIEQASGQASMIFADVVDHAQMVALFDQAAATYGGIDIVLANAGTAGESRKLHKGSICFWCKKSRFETQHWRGVGMGVR
ncbi:MAG: SDR family NAD(P)-dependent oxidoreductase [Cupriavidus necator]